MWPGRRLGVCSTGQLPRSCLHQPVPIALSLAALSPCPALPSPPQAEARYYALAELADALEELLQEEEW